MAMEYQVKLSVLLESLEYYNDVKSDGYYVVKGTNEIIKYGEDFTEGFDCWEDETGVFLKSHEHLELPNEHDWEEYAPNWSRNITFKYIDARIPDKKQKRRLKRAYHSIFNNSVSFDIPGSTKFNRTLRKLGRFEEFDQFVNEAYEADQMGFLTAWCQEHSVEILYDTQAFTAQGAS